VISQKEAYRIIKEYFKDKPVKKIQVFGSFARNEQGEDSDIDILLEMEHSVGLIAFSGYINDLEDRLGIKVDLGTTKGISPYVEPIIEKDLQLVYEK
jgi:predicted nucleotidyltransferase